MGDRPGHPFRGNQYVSAARASGGGFHDPVRDAAPPREAGFVYHATSEENLEGIADRGLVPHGPSHGTDQETWPDGSTKKRSYFIDEPAHAASFAPAEGRPVLVRVPEAGMRRESTGDRFTNSRIRAELVEVLGKNGKWYRLGRSDYEKNPARDATRGRSEAARDREQVKARRR
jgi:hypothetical protein